MAGWGEAARRPWAKAQAPPRDQSALV